MTIGAPIRLDRLQLALVNVLGSAGGLTSYQVAWSYGQGVFTDAFPASFVNLKLSGPPSFRAPPGRGASIYPIASVAWVVNSATDGALVGLYINGLPFRVSVGPLDTVTTVRDALVAAINADASGEYTASAGLGAGEWTLTASSLGSVWSLRKFGDMTATPTASANQALVTQGTASADVTIECFSKSRAPRDGAVSMASILQAVLLLPEVGLTLRDYGLGFAGLGPVIDLSAIAGGKWESRAAFDATFNLLFSVSRPVDSIGTVDLTAAMGSPVLTSTVEVASP